MRKRFSSQDPRLPGNPESRFPVLSLMRIIPPDQFPRRDPASLLQFLKLCQREAKVREHPQLASITLRVKHIDPLAVLQSIYEPGERHFYLERPQSEEALAGAEAVLEHRCSGENRFASCRDFARQVLEHTIAIGDLDMSFAGPHFFGAFTFFDEEEQDATSFAPAGFFVPRWQVGRRQGEYVAVANALVEETTPLEPLVAKILGAHGKFSSFEYGEHGSGETQVRSDSRLEEVGGADWFEQAVGDALHRIGDGAYEKIVLARAIDLCRKDTYFEPLDVLNTLREKYPSCYAFSLANGKGQSFIGATPERLLKVAEQRLFTEALAGSAPRGNSAREDASLGAALLASDKDIREHLMVIDSISRRLLSLNIQPNVTEQSRLLRLLNVQHLLTPIEALLPEGRHLLDVLAVLHPTPAVGGMPRIAAREDIRRLEPFTRGLYAGTSGWFDYRGNGEMVVNIRSALMNGFRARVYAGAGIVRGSNPQKEKQETDLKLKALLEALQPTIVA